MSGDKVNLSSQTRAIFGRKVKALRKKGIIPANVFGKKIDSQSVQLNALDFKKAFDTAGETGLINLTVDDSKSHPVLVSAVQVHPVTNQVIHVDFHQVDLKEKVTATVPIELIGEAPAVKELGAIMVNPISEVSIQALPSDIPNRFELDISSLTELGSMLTVGDIKIDSSKVTIETSPEEPVVLIQEVKAEAEPEPETESETSDGATEEASSGTPDAKEETKSE